MNEGEFLEPAGEPQNASQDSEMQLKVTELADAERKIRTGGYVALVMGILTCIVTTIAIGTGMRGLEYWDDPWMFLDVAFVFVLAIGIFRKSAVAATLMFVYFVLTRLLAIFERAVGSGIVSGIVFGIPLYRAMRASLRRRRLLQELGWATTKRRAWIWVLAGSVVLILVGIVGLVMLIETGIVPDSAAVPGNKLPNRVRSKLVESGVVEPDERVLFFYCDAMFSIMGDGNLYTDRRVISYSAGEEGLVIESASYREIEDLNVIYTNSSVENTAIWVRTYDGREFILWVSGESGLDRQFYAQLERRWKASLD